MSDPVEDHALSAVPPPAEPVHARHHDQSADLTELPIGPPEQHVFLDRRRSGTWLLSFVLACLSGLLLMVAIYGFVIVKELVAQQKATRLEQSCRAPSGLELDIQNGYAQLSSLDVTVAFADLVLNNPAADPAVVAQANTDLTNARAALKEIRPKLDAAIAARSEALLRCNAKPDAGNIPAPSSGATVPITIVPGAG